LVRMGRSSGGLYPGIRVYGPDETKLCETGISLLFTTEIADCILPSAGTYIIQARDSYGTYTGDYYLYLQRLNNPGGSVSIAFGQTLSGSISTPAEMDSYTFTANAGDKVLVRMGRSSGSLFPEIRVFNSDGTKLCEVNNSNTAFTTEIASCSLPNTGTYTILAYDHYGYTTYTGDYYIVLQRLNNSDSLGSISFGQTLPGSIGTPTKTDIYTFVASLGDTVLVRMGKSSGSLYPEIRVFGPDGTKLCEVNNSNLAFTVEIAGCSLPDTGTYTILAYDHYGYSTYTGNYSLYLQRLNNPGLPVSISFDETLPGWIDTAAKMDTYTFTGNAGGTVLVRMSKSSGSLYPEIRVFGPDGTKLCEVNNSNLAITVEIASCSLSTTGTHTILAYDHYGYGTYTGHYDLYLGDVSIVTIPSEVTITADAPEPSVTGQAVAVTVTVTGESGTPTGTVSITGANTNCSIILAGGTGNCNIIFTSAGAKTITATYSGDATYAGSTDTDAHQVQAQVAKNGGFNTYSGTSKIPKYWAMSNFASTDGKYTSIKKEGTASVRISGAAGKTKTLTQTLSLSGAKGQPFTFSYWVKGSAMPTKGSCYGQVLFYYGTSLKGTKTLRCPTGATYTWKQVKLNLTAPATYNKVLIRFTYSKASGRVWFDLASLLR
jgi:hypothetical protein